MENAPCVDFREFTARENYGEDHVSSIIAPILIGGVGAGVHHLPGPSLQLGNEGQGCESPGVCPDVDVGNCQHWSDSTSEISSFHLKSELGKAGCLLCVGVWEAAWKVRLYLDSSPGYLAS